MMANNTFFRQSLISSDLNNWGGLLMILVLWSLIWKGMSLWKSARNGDKAWFIVLLVVNTLGILDILYIYLFSKKTLKKGKK